MVLGVLWVIIPSIVVLDDNGFWRSVGLGSFPELTDSFLSPYSFCSPFTQFPRTLLRIPSKDPFFPFPSMQVLLGTFLRDKRTQKKEA